MKAQNINGFYQLLRFLSDKLGPHKYQSHFDEPFEQLLPINPFHPTRKFYFVGSYGVTASMGDLVSILMRELLDETRMKYTAADFNDDSGVVALLVWKIKRAAGHDIAMGFRIKCHDGSEEDHIAFGFTDYSGEGGRGYRDLYSILCFVSKLFEVPILETQVPLEHFEVVEEMVRNQAGREL